MSVYPFLDLYKTTRTLVSYLCSARNTFQRSFGTFKKLPDFVDLTKKLQGADFAVFDQKTFQTCWASAIIQNASKTLRNPYTQDYYIPQEMIDSFARWMTLIGRFDWFKNCGFSPFFGAFYAYHFGLPLMPYVGEVYRPPAQSCNHAVVLTGYGITEDGVKFYDYLNSGGCMFGDGGYGKILHCPESIRYPLVLKI
ncbi:hypothetical protein TIFTF001_012979 [Ficus carica]|uniref:Peptidase C1A papain C-terminal domain-containing protein n=1 Tax=Ficus carica TaxID=3494 RepID=A0AA88D2F9_FICCA|nr:hypothetical protein TIFTF001_012979 [Ficus carica]